MLNQGVPQVFMLTHYSTAFGCGVRQRKVLKYVLQDFSLFCFIKKRCVRDSNSSRNPFCTNILFNQVFKVQRLIQREEFAVLLSFDRLNWNNAKIVKNNNMTKFRYITHCFFEVFVLS